jgi:hypothetical protein
MRWFEFIAVILLLILLVGALYLLWTYIPTEQVEYEAFKAEVSQDLPTSSAQFYPNMRYPNQELTFVLSDACSEKKKKDFREATQILETKTILKFIETTSEESDITISCSKVAPKPEQEDHFVAGEGGPSLFINTSRYATILEGEIALYRAETCDTPQVALHELLHALGFDHNSNENSIMFPVTNCDQTVDSEITSEINRLYSQPALADLTIESIDANKSGRYLNFDVVIANNGLKSVPSSSLDIETNNELLKTFDIGDIEIGAKRHLTVSNFRIPRNAEQIKFISQTTQQEISKENNAATIRTSG